MKIFKKEKEFINNLSLKKKKYLVYFFLFFFLIIIDISLVKLDSLYIFLYIIIVSFSYKVFTFYLIYNIIENDKYKITINYYLKKYIFIYELLKTIHKWKNPLILLCIYIDNIFLKIIRSLSSNLSFLEKEKKKKFLNFLQFLILNILFGPLKIFFGFFYNVLNNIIQKPFSLLFIIRCIGFLYSILIFSNIFYVIYNYFGIYIFIYIYIYIILFCFIIKYINLPINLKYILCYLSSDYLIVLRNSSTITGIVVSIPLRYKLKIFKKKDINIISSVFKAELEDGFYKYWEYQKKNKLLFFDDIWKERKNKPSFFIYINIINWLSPRSFIKINEEKIYFSYCPADNITNILYYKYKVESLNIILSDDIFEILDYLYNVDLLKLKLLLFMLWDIDNYIDNNNWNYITFYKNEKNQYVISPNSNIYDFLDSYNFKVEKNKENLFFYDLEANMKFFDNLYKVIGVITITENPDNFYIINDNLYNDLNKNIYQKLNKFYQNPNIPESWTWNRDYENGAIDRNNMPLIENKIKDWIIIFLKETRDEWILLKKAEKDITERNWKLLNQIENLLLKK